MLNQSFIQQIFTESLLTARPCAECLGYIHEQKGQDGVSWRPQSNYGQGDMRKMRFFTQLFDSVVSDHYTAQLKNESQVPTLVPGRQ